MFEIGSGPLHFVSRSFSARFAQFLFTRGGDLDQMSRLNVKVTRDEKVKQKTGGVLLFVCCFLDKLLLSSLTNKKDTQIFMFGSMWT